MERRQPYSRLLAFLSLHTDGCERAVGGANGESGFVACAEAAATNGDVLGSMNAEIGI